tara:strand:- start:10 stop:333 length:324 start_codon:yes stop_codon:yes gene_type:complete
MNKKQYKREVIIFLESLVHKRFSEKELRKVLSDFFKQDLNLYNASQGRIDNGEYSDELADFNFMFNVVYEDFYELFGDVYMLPTREVSDDDENTIVWYVTEVGYEFN